MYHEFKSGQCGICLNPLPLGKVYSCAEDKFDKHAFCETCTTNLWEKTATKTCPFCKEPFTSDPKQHAVCENIDPIEAVNEATATFRNTILGKLNKFFYPVQGGKVTDPDLNYTRQLKLPEELSRKPQTKYLVNLFFEGQDFPLRFLTSVRWVSDPFSHGNDTGVVPSFVDLAVNVDLSCLGAYQYALKETDVEKPLHTSWSLAKYDQKSTSETWLKVIVCFVLSAHSDDGAIEADLATDNKCVTNLVNAVQEHKDQRVYIYCTEFVQLWRELFDLTLSV
jgi:hypothetical protein